jgi:hypothetical protein
MVAPNNAILYNASIESFVAGLVRDRWLTEKNTGTPPAIGTADPSYAAIVAQATNFAVELDSKIPTDDVASPQPAGTQAISVVTTGVAIAPTTGPIQFGQISKYRLFAASVLGMVEGRYYGQPANLTASQLSSLAASVAATYNQVAIVVVQPLAPVTPTNNELLYFAAYAGAVAGTFSATPGGIPADLLLAAEGYIQFLCVAIDAAIANDATISTGASNGPAVAPSTGAIQTAQLGKTRLLYSIVLATQQARNPISVGLTTNPEFTAWGVAVAPAIVAAYKAMVGGLTPAGSGSILNPVLYNEAYCGFVAGKLSGRPITSTSATDPNYVAISAAAVAFATEVDAAVGAGDFAGTAVPTGTQAITVSAEPNTTIVPTTGTIQEGQLGKTGLMWAICRGVQNGRPLLGDSLDTTAASYSAIAQSIVALYLDLTLALLTP